MPNVTNKVFIITQIVLQKTIQLPQKQNSGRLHNPQEYATRAAQA
jgi:hypothetical protein